MDLTRKQRFTKYICYCVLILIADLIQNIGGLMPEIFGARCFIIIPSLIILIIGEDEITAASLGLFAGLLWDLSSAVHLGFNCIFFAVICFIISLLINHLIRDTFITNMIFCGISIVIYCLIYWLAFIVIKGVDGGETTLMSFYLPCAIYTAIVTPIVFIIYKPIKKKLNKR